MTVERAIPMIPQPQTKTKKVLRMTLRQPEMMPAHMVPLVSWWALTTESGRMAQKDVNPEPARRIGA